MQQQVIGLVDLTCAAIKNDAAGTVAAINAGEAPYVDAENAALCAFVHDRNVKRVAIPDQTLPGRTVKGVPDATGRLFRDALVSGALADGSGWIEYVKAEPDSAELSRIASYYRLKAGSDGVQYVVGAGRYLGPTEGVRSTQRLAGGGAQQG